MTYSISLKPISLESHPFISLLLFTKVFDFIFALIKAAGAQHSSKVCFQLYLVLALKNCKSKFFFF